MPERAALARRVGPTLTADATRVAATLFLPGQESFAPGASRSAGILERLLALPEDDVVRDLAALTASFAGRHRDLPATWDAHFRLVRHRLPAAAGLSADRERLVGAYFTQEIAVEAAGLLNPSMVAHPDQSGVAAGALRFVMTLRAIGEGHRSSLELRTGVVDAAGEVVMDPAPGVVVLAERRETRLSRAAVAHQLREPEGPPDPELDADVELVLGAVPETFGTADLGRALALLHTQRLTRGSTGRTADRFARVVANTYAVEFPESSDLHERVLTPHAPAESHGIEDVRLVRLVGPDGTAEHVGTYTAHDGHAISMQLLRSPDLRRFTSAPLSGPGAQDKGLALFPRQVGGSYLALSRADREDNALTRSSDLLHWGRPEVLQTPVEPWELVQLGNCGSPVETERGWLVLTHGVGPMRTYGIGALLLDLEDPARVVGRLDRPLLLPTADERWGYVPNVVYSCGAMRHGDRLVLPYGCSDVRTRFAVVDLDPLLDALERGAPPRSPRPVRPPTTEELR